jgi:UDP-N-acetylmuramyl pentapeptide phosphotransferase/UDP-N-acetylglucosamine-1-phosphate transferase
MYDIVLAFVTSFLLTFFAIPSIISLARKKHLLDEPGERRSHSVSTPSLGGIGIFVGTLISILIWTPFKHFGDLQYILGAFIVIFLLGNKDDLDPVKPKVKFLIQIVAAAILIFIADIRITSLYGIFGIESIPFVVSVALSFFIFLVIINAFNLIDGINGLSGSIGVLMALSFGTWFFVVNRFEMASVAFALIGAIVAFLYYNVTPAKIFVGETGSLFLGIVAAILAISFIEHHQVLYDSRYMFESAPAVAVGILILPLFDTLRLVVTRIIAGKSPFEADKNHIHHMLLDIGLSHMQATANLIIINMLFIILVFKLDWMGTFPLLIMLLITSIAMTGIISLMRNWMRHKRSQVQNSY